MIEVTGTVKGLDQYQTGFGDDKRVGYQVKLDLPFGWASVTVEAGTPAPKLGDVLVLSLMQPEIGEDV